VAVAETPDTHRSRIARRKERPFAFDEAGRGCREANDPSRASPAGIRRQNPRCDHAEDVQQMKYALTERSPTTVNNVLTTLSVVLKTTVEWGVIDRLTDALRDSRHFRGARVLSDAEASRSRRRSSR
jgi:hypothetical protein